MPDITLFPGQSFFGRLIVGPPSDPIRVSNQQASIVVEDNAGYQLPMSRIRVSNQQASLVVKDGQGYVIANPPAAPLRLSNVQASLVSEDANGYVVSTPPAQPLRLSNVQASLVTEDANGYVVANPPVEPVRLSNVQASLVTEDANGYVVSNPPASYTDFAADDPRWLYESGTATHDSANGAGSDWMDEHWNIGANFAASSIRMDNVSILTGDNYLYMSARYQNSPVGSPKPKLRISPTGANTWSDYEMPVIGTAWPDPGPSIYGSVQWDELVATGGSTHPYSNPGGGNVDLIVEFNDEIVQIDFAGVYFSPLTILDSPGGP